MIEQVLTKWEKWALSVEADERNADLVDALAEIRGAMAQQSQDANKEVVTMTVPLSHVNSLQVESIKRLVVRTKHAHMTDVQVRINGNYEYFEADWLKYVVIGGGA